MNASAHRDQRCQMSLDLNLKVVVNLLMWVLIIEKGQLEEQYVHLTTIPYPSLRRTFKIAYLSRCRFGCVDLSLTTKSKPKC